MFEVITSHRLSSVQASTSRSITGKVQRNRIGSNCDNMTVGRRAMDATWDNEDAMGMGPVETVDMLDQHMRRADWTQVICNLTRSSCIARRLHGVWSKRKKLTLNIFHFHFLLPLHECNYEHNFLTNRSCSTGCSQHPRLAL